MTNKELIQKFEALVKIERRVTRQVLEHIAQIESRKAYVDLGYDGMYSYMTKGLGYSDGSAYRRIKASRVLRADSKVAAKVEAGKLNLMQLATVAKVSRQTNQVIQPALLDKLEGVNQSNSQQMIAEAFEIPPIQITKQNTQRDHSVKLELTFTKEQFVELEKAKSLLSPICPEGDWVEVLTELARQFSKKMEAKDSSSKKAGLQKIAHSEVRTARKGCIEDTSKQSASSKNTHSAPTGKTPLVRRQSVSREYISVQIKRQIYKRSSGGCEHVNRETGEICCSKYQPQLDHIVPISRGGSNAAENLQLLCGFHNRLKSNRLT